MTKMRFDFDAIDYFMVFIGGTFGVAGVAALVLL